MSTISDTYAERMYAGVLGKIIGVYLGRPFEGWSHERILAELGEVDEYVHDRFDLPLVVTDDDIAGTFTFLRALEDNDFDPDLSAAKIGDAWLNYLVENRTVLWWGGLGVSTEHTAYLRLKSGIAAPESGSSRLNGTTIAEQIGAQIFIDGWAMLCPGDPERAVDMARRAASVSHDAEAVYGAQVIAAMEAQAFVEPDITRLLDTALEFIPADSVISRLIGDIREWHATDDDWRSTLRNIQEQYGYDRYRGACHMVPNHALIIHALLHGGDDFRRSLMIVNTSGWDTDCNSGNVGAILSIKNGLVGIDTGPVDWRGPVADRMYLSTAEGGRAITDALTESYRIVNAGRALQRLDPVIPKDGARFHFSLPGSVQGFQSDDAARLVVSNSDGRLALTTRTGQAACATTPTFIPPEALDLGNYPLLASPTLHPGQIVSASVMASATNAGNVDVTLFIRLYGVGDTVQDMDGPAITLAPGERSVLDWKVLDTGGLPICAVGFRVEGDDEVTLLVDRIDWRGAPSTVLGRPAADNSMWRRAWIDGVDQWNTDAPHDFAIVQNHGTGVMSQGNEYWWDYSLSATVTVPLAASAGIAARVGGLRRYIALVIEQDGFARLIRMAGERSVLAEIRFVADPDQVYELELRVEGAEIRGRIGDGVVLEGVDAAPAFRGGAAGFVISEGTLLGGPLRIVP